MPKAPGEADLERLARRFAEAERRVRRLVAKAAEGDDRRHLLTEALDLLTDLRRLDVGDAVAQAYVRAFAAANSARARSDRVDSERVGALAGALSKKLDDAVRTAQDGSERAFRRVTVDNLEEMVAISTTGYIDASGRRWPLGHFAEMTTATIGRQATSLGTVDAMGDGLVIVEGATTDAICSEFVGNTYRADTAPEPPFHPSCGCLLTPV